MAEAVYILCAITSLVCAWLLLRQYRATRMRLLFWSSICFVGLVLNNVLLVVDLVFTGPTIDLSLIRTIPAFAGLLTLVIALVWEAR